MKVETHVPGFGLLPLDLRKTEVGRTDGRYPVIGVKSGILVVNQAFSKTAVTGNTPARTEGEHAHHFLQRLEEGFVADIPASGHTGEETPLVAGTELGAAVGAQSEV